MYRKILFCSDLYPSSDYAFLTALEIAEQSGAELIVLHVLESRHRYAGHFITYDGEVWASSDVIAKLEKNMAQYYKMRIEAQTPDFVRFVVRAGTSWLEILRAARQEDADLIVMSPFTVQDPGDDTQYARNEIGPTAQQVSLKARCPVSIVKSPKQRIKLKVDL